MARSIGLPLSVTLLCLALYLITLGGKFYSIDEDLYLRMTQSLVRKGSFAIMPIEYAPGFSVAVGRDNQVYANRGPGFPIVAAPFFRLGDALTRFGSGYTEPSKDGIAEPTVFTVAVTLANTLMTGIAIALLFATITLLGYNPRTAAVVSLLFGLGTMAWPYASKSFFAEPLLMLCTLGSFYWALKFRLDAVTRRRPNLICLGLSACCLGYAILTKVTALALLPVLAGYLLATSLESKMGSRNVRWAALAFGAIAVFFVGILAWYNFARFGSLFKTGYEIAGMGSESLLISSPVDLFVGLYGLLFSPGKGLVFHALPVLLGVVGIRRFWKSHRLEAAFIVSASLATILGVAMWRDWSGGWCWGPRLILNALPLLMIPAAAFLDSGSLSPAGWRRLVWPVFLFFGVLTQLMGVLPDYLAWYLRVGNYNLVYYNPAYAPLRGHLEALLRGEVDLFWLKTESFFPGAGAIAVGILVGLVAIALVAALAFLYYWRESDRREVTVQ